jgi:RNA polymerase sigma-70 factor (ECF subfamily)
MELLKDSRSASETEVSEEEMSVLVLQAQAHDPEAFARIFVILQSKLHRQALFLTGDEFQALDLLQETMFETWKHLQRYDGRVRFFTWICSIMAHRHYDWLRRLRTRAFIALAHAPDDAAPAPCPSQTSADLDRARLLRQCLDQLPGKQRMVVYLRFYAGESLEGIAAILQCSLGTVKSRLFHALERLAKMEKLKELREDI